MKAIINQKYGTPDIMEFKEVKKPEPKANEVLIRVLAASVNKADYLILSGKPFPVRLMAGLTKPKYKVLGADIAGIVEQVGIEVTQFRPGQEVFGDLSGSGFGGFAEYVVADENKLALKPSNLTYEQTAALPMAAVTALQGIRDKGKLKIGEEILINGASGGVGGFAIQVAKALGSVVTAVCSTSKVELAIKQGADHVIDYKKEDFTTSGKQYDVIFDVVANHSIGAMSKVLKKGGRYVACAFSPAVMLTGPLRTMFSRKKFTSLLASTNQADLQFISKLAEEDKLHPVIQQTFTLDDVLAALKIIGTGSASGKLVITI